MCLDAVPPPPTTVPPREELEYLVPPIPPMVVEYSRDPYLPEVGLTSSEVMILVLLLLPLRALNASWWRKETLISPRKNYCMLYFLLFCLKKFYL